MNETLIKNWNEIIKPSDEVYHLGDFSFSNPEPFRKRLNGKINLICGSHDYYFKSKLSSIFDSVALMRILKQVTPNIILCHYAMRSWYASHRGSIMLYGHSHGKLPPYGLSFDVGVDCWDYKPVSYETVMQKVKDLEKEMNI